MLRYAAALIAAGVVGSGLADPASAREGFGGHGGGFAHHEHGFDRDRGRDFGRNFFFRDRFFFGGIYLDSAADILYSLDIDQGLLTASNAASGKELTKLAVGGRPYDMVRARNGLLYISDWAGRQVVVVQPRDNRVIGRIGLLLAIAAGIAIVAGMILLRRNEQRLSMEAERALPGPLRPPSANVS